MNETQKFYLKAIIPIIVITIIFSWGFSWLATKFEPPISEQTVYWHKIDIAGKDAYFSDYAVPEHLDIPCHYISFESVGWIAFPVENFSPSQVDMIIRLLEYEFPKSKNREDF